MAKHMAMTRQAKPVNYCIISWRNGAKRRGIEWQLTDEFLITLAAETTVCPILGIPLVYDCHTGAGAGKTNPNRASLDRVDSSKGYTPDNVRIVSWAFNNLKNTFTDEQLYAYCKAFVNYMENK